MGVTPTKGGYPKHPTAWGEAPRQGGCCSAGRRRPATRAHFSGMHARFLFFVWSIVSRLVRAQLVKSAGRIFYVHGRPAQLVGWSVVDRARARPAVVRPLCSCGVLWCAAVCCGVLWCSCGVPGRARARRGSCEASRARVVRPCTPGRLQGAPLRRHVATDGRCGL